MNSNTTLNPAAVDYTPAARSLTNSTPQLSTPPSPYLEARLLNLEEQHFDLRGDVENLTELYHQLRSTFSTSKNDRRPFDLSEDPAESRQSALQLQQELQSLTTQAHKSKMSKTNGSVPPHLRAASTVSNGSATNSLPPHLRGKVDNGSKEAGTPVSANNPLVTDGPVDTVTKANGPAAIPSPPHSPVTVVHSDLPMDKLSLSAWKPHYVTNLAPFKGASKIPAASEMVSFHPQFLDNCLSGSEWSPGMRFVVGTDTCMLKNRTYFVLRPSIDPFLPEHPGGHGAKLVPFFNVSPEDVHGNVPDDVSSSEDVPVFVESGGRYVYFGNYSQTRWSDKVGHDTMMAHVPEHVKEYWAKELTSTLRPDWLTEALKEHFFKKPDYDGRVYAPGSANATTVDSDEEAKITEKMVRDVNKYVQELREWEREANMKTSMIKKETILDAFNSTDAEDPPALRLWWEYLECVDWREDFYDLLVTLQRRTPAYVN